MSIKIFKPSEWNYFQNVTAMARYASAVNRCSIKVTFKAESTF